MRMKSNIKKLAYMCGSVAALLLVISIFYFTTPVDEANAGAAAGSDSTGGSSGGSCDGKTYWGGGYGQMDCIGAAWKEYSVGASPSGTKDNSHYASDKAILAKIDSACAEMGSYYRQGLARFRGKTTSPSFNGGLAYFKTNSQVSPLGSIPYRSDATGVSQSSVQTKFNQAKEYYQNQKDAGEELDSTTLNFLSQSWENTSWFCWNESMADPNETVSEFAVWSTAHVLENSVEVLTVRTPTVDSDASDTLTTKADTITVNFVHRFRYTKPKQTGTFDPAETKYGVNVTNAGTSSIIVPANTVFTADPDAAEQVAVGESTQTVDVPSETGETVTVCSEISYDPKTLHWKETASGSSTYQVDTTEGSAKSKVCVIIERGEPDEEEEDDEEVGYVEFWSRSYVTSTGGSDVPSHTVWTNEKTTGDKVTLHMSTDYATGSATIGHQMSYEVHLQDGISIGANDTIADDLCTTWTVAATGATGDYCYNKTTPSPQTVTTKDYPSISVPGGKEEQIVYTPKKISIKRTEIKTNACGTTPPISYTCSYNPKRYNYAASGPGEDSGDSAAAIDFVKPDVPGGNGTSTTGLVDAGPMGVGESTNMQWQTEAKAHQTRRIMEYQAIAFEYPVEAGRNDNYVKGNLDFLSLGRTNYAPCSYWPTKHSLRACAQASDMWGDSSWGSKGFPGDGGSENATHVVNTSRDIVVPDYVGDIYCTSFGYRWEYWYGVENTKDDQGSNTGITWRSDGQSYWTHYDAACRSIAKKPSISIWNSSIFANTGDLYTSIAPRYANTAVGTPTSAGGELKRFGSWTEYLAVLNSGIVQRAGSSEIGFASGAAISLGTTHNDLLKNSPLTIANTSDPVGASGINQNSVYQNRLGNYLWNNDPARASAHSIAVVGSIGEIGTKLGEGYKTVIVQSSGIIDQPVKLSNYGYTAFTTVYDLPQIIIYVPSGDVEIRENVDQIDAWIVAPNGKLKTCSNFADSTTEAKVFNWNTANQTCYKQLKINGPVIARTVDPKRTYGAERQVYSSDDKDTANAAPDQTMDNGREESRSGTGEVFNLSADVYLWAYAQAGRYDSSYTEAYARELPPRY